MSALWYTDWNRYGYCHCSATYSNAYSNSATLAYGLPKRYSNTASDAPPKTSPNP